MADYYCRPTTGSDSNAGTSHAAASATIQNIFAKNTRSSGGDTIWLQTGDGDHQVTAPLDPTVGTWGGVPSASSPLRLEAYTTTAGDNPGGVGARGQAVVDGNGTGIWVQAAGEGFVANNIHFKNGGSSTLVATDRNCLVLNCIFSDTSGTGLDLGINVGNFTQNCIFYDLGYGVKGAYMTVSSCYFSNQGTNEMTRAVWLSGGYNSIENCTFSLDGSSDGVGGPTNAWSHSIRNNTFFTSGTGTAIDITRPRVTLIEGNYFEGWGRAIYTNYSTELGVAHGNNRYYDITNSDTLVGDFMTVLPGDATLSNTGIAKTGTAMSPDDWLTYFAPVDEGTMLTGGTPEVSA